MINKKKNKKIEFSRLFSRVGYFFRESVSFWRWFGTVSAILIFFILFHLLTSVYLYGGSIFGKRVEGARIESIKVRTGSTFDRDLLLKALNLKPGMPFYDREGKLFSGDLEKKVAEIMKNAPTIASLEIMRQPSNSISVVVTERIPVARFAGSHLAVDASGVVFGSGSSDHVPDFLGFPRNVMEPGQKLDFSKKNQAAALELVNYMNDIGGNVNGIQFSLTSIDISNSYRLFCVFNGGINVDIAWNGMGEGNPDALVNLKKQLVVLAKTITHPQSSGGRRYNLTHPNKCYMK